MRTCIVAVLEQNAIVLGDLLGNVSNDGDVHGAEAALLAWQLHTWQESPNQNNMVGAVMRWEQPGAVEGATRARSLPT